MHLIPTTITNMCTKSTLQDLPKHPKECTQTLYNCTICYRTKFNHPEKGHTHPTDNLEKGELLQVDFEFYDIPSICGFISVFTIIDANTRKLWCFRGPDKKPPVTKIYFF